MNIPIVIAAFNREHALQRLLNALSKGRYPDSVNLIISIDGGGPCGVRRVSEEFDWQHGQKEIIAHQENLGLRRHILSCGELSRNYDGIILLEDDLYVSPSFYEYAIAALEFYQHTQAICGVSLYAYQYNETAFLPFTPLNDGSDVYFMQLPCSWGQAWLKAQWTDFRAWYDLNSTSNFQDDPKLPPNIALWPDTSWKKYFLKYMVEKDKFFVYPRNSYSTNFGDKGQHHQGTNVFQVPLACDVMGNYRFKEFIDCLVKYDVFCELLPDCLGTLCCSSIPADLSVDLYGSKRMENLVGEYLITPKKSRNYEASFALRMLPPEMNIINRIAGNELFLTRVDQLEKLGNINDFLYGNASSESSQRYYFGTDDVHYLQLRDAEVRLAQAERAIGLLKNTSTLTQHVQQLESSFHECKARINAMEASLSWRITKPLRWLGDTVRGIVSHKR